MIAEMELDGKVLIFTCLVEGVKSLSTCFHAIGGVAGVVCK